MTREEKRDLLISEYKARDAVRKASGRYDHCVEATEEQYARWAESQLNRDEMAATKDVTVIPSGDYCYGTTPCGTNGVCPYWSNPKLSVEEQKPAGVNEKNPRPLNLDRSKWFAHCSFLERDSDYNEGMLGSMSLIWDQVKECGQNPERPLIDNTSEV